MTPQNGDGQQSWVMSLLDEYEVKLTHYANRILGDVELARDVVQQTFLKLCDVNETEIGDHTAAWLYTVCRNQALDELRRRRRTQPWDDLDRTPGSQDDDPAAKLELRETCSNA